MVALAQLITTKNPSIGKRVKEDFKQYYHHWFLGVSHQLPAILQNQQEDQVWSSKLHSSNDSSLDKRWEWNVKLLERIIQTKTNPCIYVLPLLQ